MNFSLSTVLNTLVGSSLFAAIAVLLICRCKADRGIKLYTVFFFMRGRHAAPVSSV